MLALAAGTLLGGCRRATPEAAPARSTLEKIRATGIITLGHRDNSIPFSYFDDQQHVVGY
ncbi:MAG: amino acid ABC transporter substrate-binding protein, partial [Proteobacteria bacterium]|nr:amino acid ABC transporter substrate-binding protein [Pseudomonadota bacterium]